MKLSQFTSTTGVDGDSLALSKTKSLVPVVLPQTSNVFTDSIEFNSTEGKLSWIMSNGEVKEASGFLTLNQLGRGSTGKRGYTGRKGRDGKKGKNGRIGDDGCAGPMGITGATGYDGEDGEDGEPGIQGGWGAPGGRGPDGATGGTGLRGFQGSMGKQGVGCIVGPTGPDGLIGNGAVFVAEELPPEDYYLWLSYITPEELAFTDITANLNDINLGLYNKGGFEYQTEGIFNITNIDGGSGDYDIIWSGDFKTNPNIIDFQVSKNKRQLRIVAHANLEPKQSIIIEGDVIATVHDRVDLNVKGTATGHFKFTARNSEEAAAGPLYMSVSDASAVEGNPLTFMVGLNRVSSEPIQFNYSVIYGSASSNDIAGSVGTGSINPGEVSKPIVIQARSDSDSESTEVFTLKVYSAVAAERNPRDWQATGTIMEGEDSPVVVSSSALSVTEGDVDKNAYIPFALGGTLPKGSPADLSFQWRTLSGTALEGADFTSASGTVTFDKDFQSTSIIVNIIGDNIRESSQFFNIEVFDVGRMLKFNSTITKVTIQDDDGSTGGGGGGCIVFGQKVLVSDTLVNIEDLGVGEDILGREVPKAPSVYSWSSESVYPEVQNTVVACQHSTYNKFVRINNTLELTPDHLILTKRKGVWRWLNSGNVVLGDELLGRDGEVLVTDTKLIHGIVRVVDLDVEYFDTYYVSGFLVHNAELGRRVKN